MTEDALAPLREKFRARAALEAAALRRCLLGEDLMGVEPIAHGLSGAAGLFGFADVAMAAKAVDDVFAQGRLIEADAVRRLIATLERIA